MHVLPQIRVGEPTSHGGLTVFPLFTPPRETLDYVLSDEALESGSAAVSEVSESGSVPELEVLNDLDRAVLFLEGEELQGAKQNRILNTSVLVGAHGKTRIPVTCVEQGRWSYRSALLRHAGHHASSSLRHLLKKTVTESTLRAASHHSDQRAVWGKVREEGLRHGTQSPTGAMAANYVAYAERLGSYREHLPYAEGATGLAVAVGQRLVFLDLFDRPATLEKTWDRLLSGAVLEAIARRAPDDTRPEASAVEDLWARMRDAPWTEAPPIGEGQEFRCAAGDELQAASLGTAEELVHCSATVLA
jgi:hypothetical protein